VCPKGADYQWGKDPLEQLMVRFDSWRAASTGNGAGRNLATKSTHGGRAIWQAVTRVKLEQASKAAMWTPTRRKTGEGSTDGEEARRGSALNDNRRALIGSTGVVSTACQKGNRASVGEARDGCGRSDLRTSSVSASGDGALHSFFGLRGERSANVVSKGGGPSGRRKGSDVPRKPGNAGGGKGPDFWCV